VEEVKLIDDFTNKKTGRTSNCFRISYRSNERSLTDEEINDLQARRPVKPFLCHLVIAVIAVASIECFACRLHCHATCQCPARRPKLHSRT